MKADEVVSNYRNKFLLSTPLHTDLGGGWNTRISPPELKTNQAMVCRNVIFNAASGALTPRDGTKKLFLDPYNLTVATHGLFHAKFSAGWAVIVAPDAGLFAHAGGVGDLWVDASGTLPARSAPADNRVNMDFYNDMVIGFDGTNDPFKISYDGANFTGAPLGGSPPKGCRFLVVWNNYVFAAGDGTNKLYFCESSNPDSWPGNNYIIIGGLTDGDEITGIGLAYGHLVVFKRNSIYAISGTSTADFSQTQLAQNEGLISDGCLASAGNELWFLGHNGASYIGSDLRPQFVSDYVTYNYKADITKIDPTLANRPSAAYNFKKNQMWFSMDSDGDGEHDRVFVHDLLNKDESGRPAISEYLFYMGSGANYTPRHMAQYHEASGAKGIISVNIDGYVYKHDVTTAEGVVGDDGNLVDWVYQTKFYNLGDPMRLKTPRYYQAYGRAIASSSTATNRNHKYQSATDSYAVLESMVYPRRGVHVETVGGKIYAIGGYDASGDGYLDVVEEYDPSTDSWATKTAMPVPIAFGASATDGTHIYIIGGSTDGGAARDTVYRYTPSTDTWTTMAPMPTARYFLMAEYYNGKIYAVGGQTTALLKVSALEEYDVLSDAWASLTSHPGAGNILGTLTESGGALYMIGGSPLGAGGYKYDIGADSWSAIADMPAAKMEHFAGAIGSDIYVTGGFWDASATRTSYLYDPAGNSWTAKTEIITDRYWGGSAVVGGDMYIIGGQGLAATLTLRYTDDFTTQTSVTSDLLLNQRVLFPSAFSKRARYISVEFKAKISEGITNLTGWTMDYMMWQRRT